MTKPVQMTLKDIKDVAKLLTAIENGDVTLTCLEEPQEIYAGNVYYTASDGSNLVVFNDCNEWDYLDSVQLADGRTFDYDALNSRPRGRDIRECYPDEVTAWKAYGIPGYLSNRKERWSKGER